jgi:hypothetical protein
MKNIINSICSFLEALAQARAAATLTRAGKINEAKALYSK